MGDAHSEASTGTEEVRVGCREIWRRAFQAGGRINANHGGGRCWNCSQGVRERVAEVRSGGMCAWSGAG